MNKIKNCEYVHISGFIIHIFNDEIYIDKDFIFSQIPKESRIKLLPIALKYKTGPIAKAFSIYQVLAMIMNLSFSDHKKALELLDICEKINKEFATLNNFVTFQQLRDAISFHALYTMKCLCNIKESDGIQKRFKDSIKDLIPNAKIIDDYKFNRSNVPDFMIDINGSIRPVEIKKEKATGQAVKQILRYVDFYKSDKGYLVAPELRADIPGNIIYVKFN